MCFHLPALSLSPSPGQRDEQAGGVPAAHPEPVRNVFECQQKRQRHAAGALRGPVSGELLVAPSKPRQHAEGRRCQTVGIGQPPAALAGRRDQNAQEEERGAGQSEAQKSVGVLEEKLRLSGGFRSQVQPVCTCRTPSEVLVRRLMEAVRSRFCTGLQFPTWTLEGVTEA